jgi:hypothetical protein
MASQPWSFLMHNHGGSVGGMPALPSCVWAHESVLRVAVVRSVSDLVSGNGAGL